MEKEFYIVIMILFLENCINHIWFLNWQVWRIYAWKTFLFSNQETSFKNNATTQKYMILSSVIGKINTLLHDLQYLFLGEQ